MTEFFQPTLAVAAADTPPLPLVVVYLALGLVGLGVDALLVFGPWVTLKGWVEGVGRLKRRPVLPLDGLLMLGLALLAVALLLGGSVLLAPARDGGEREGVALGMVVSSLVLHWGGLAMVLGWLRLRKLRFREVFSRRGRNGFKDFGLGMGLYLGLVPLLVVYAVIYEYLARMVGHEITPQSLVEVLREIRSPWMLVYFGVLVAFIGPLAEELAFRGVALPLLARRLGVVPAVMVVSAVFVMLHGSFDAIGPLFIVALGFTLAYVYTSSIWVAAGMHTAFNGVNLVLLLAMRGQGVVP